MQVIGHRGCLDHYPENTRRAVRGSAPHVDVVEIDIQRCGSGEIVVFHDAKLNRLTDARGYVKHTDYETLSSLTIGQTSESIPLFEEILDVLPAGTGLNVELKHDGMAKEIAPLLREFDEQVIVSSFEPEALAEFQHEPIPTAYLCPGPVIDHLDTAEAIGCEYIHPHFKATDARAIEAAHDRGISLNAWTVPTREAVTRLGDAGVDGVIVDSWTVVPERRQRLLKG